MGSYLCLMVYHVFLCCHTEVQWTCLIRIQRCYQVTMMWQLSTTWRGQISSLWLSWGLTSRMASANFAVPDTSFWLSENEVTLNKQNSCPKWGPGYSCGQRGCLYIAFWEYCQSQAWHQTWRRSPCLLAVVAVGSAPQSACFWLRSSTKSLHFWQAVISSLALPSLCLSSVLVRYYVTGHWQIREPGTVALRTSTLLITRSEGV